MNRRQFFLLLLLFLIVGCSKRLTFDFNKKWEWSDLKSVTTNKQTLGYIDNLSRQVSVNDARFLFIEITNLKNPNDIYELMDIEADQYNRGGGFYNILPRHFNDKSLIPKPVDFQGQIKLALYLAKVRNIIIQDMKKSGIYYNYRLKNKEINEYTAKKSNITLTLHTDYVNSILKYYNGDNNSLLENLSTHEVNMIMLSERQKLDYLTAPYPTATDMAEFIRNSSKEKPLYKIWNWVNPANNFGYSELYTNRKIYQSLIDYLEKKERDFTGSIVAPLSRYFPQDKSYQFDLHYAVNFGVNHWSKNNHLGMNIVQMKDDFRRQKIFSRQEIFKQMHKTTCITSPELNDQREITYNDLKKWNFASEKDRKFYRYLFEAYQLGLSSFICGTPKHFQFFTQVKAGMGIINQAYSAIYQTENDQIYDQLVAFGTEKYGPLTGLGYLMSRAIKTQYGEAELTRCLVNGPVYFFNKFYQYRRTKPGRTFVHIKDETGQKIEELYQKQLKYFQK